MPSFYEKHKLNTTKVVNDGIKGDKDIKNSLLYWTVEVIFVKEGANLKYNTLSELT